MTSSSCDSFSTRIKDTAGVSVRHLQCAICQDLLWKPVECADCRKLYCEKCVLNKLLNTSEIEPPCQNYIEGECHPVIINQLSCLRIACIHQPNGCPEVISYDTLETHQNGCDYAYRQCSGCNSMVLAKDFATHVGNCELIKLTCEECHLVYRRKDESLHTATKCLREQMLQGNSKLQAEFEAYRNQQAEVTNKLLEKLDQLTNKIQELDVINQNLNRRLYETSLTIHNSMPPYPALWNSEAVTVAGGHERGDATHKLNNPSGLCVDDDQTVYIADSQNHRIMAWRVDVAAGVVVAGGNGQGNGLDQFSGPTDVIVDGQTDTLLICDYGNRRVMRWPRLHRALRQPEIVIDNIGCCRLAKDNQGSLYVSDEERHEVRRFDNENDRVGTVVAGGHGEGNALNQLNWPTYLFVDAQFTLYVSDHNNHRIMKWVRGASEGIVAAGEDAERLPHPGGLWVDGLGHIYVADATNDRVLRWENGTAQATVIAGGQRRGSRACQLSSPADVFFDRCGHLYVSDCRNHRVQRFSLISNHAPLTV